MNTRSIQSPPSYYGSKIIPVGFTSAIAEARVKVASLESNIGVIAGVMEQHDFPTYYVSAPLMEALKMSRPPDGLKWCDLKLPFPAAVFMIPRKSLIEPPPTECEIACVGYAKFPSGVNLPIPTIGNIGPLPETRMSIFWFLGPSGLEMNDSTFPDTHPLEPMADWIDMKSEGRPYGGPTGKFSAYVAGLVANFILLMEARRELIEPGARIFKATREGRPDVYAPTFIGRNYSIIRKDKTETVDRKSQFTELGWRAGHFKRQHFGERNEQVKTIFVDPYIAFSRGLTPLKENAQQKGET